MAAYTALYVGTMALADTADTEAESTIHAFPLTLFRFNKDAIEIKETSIRPVVIMASAPRDINATT